MEKLEAEEIALEFIRREFKVIYKIENTVFISSQEGPNPGGSPDVWLVGFKRPLPKGIAVIDPSGVTVEVDDATGDVSFFGDL